MVCCVSPVARLGEAGALLARTQDEGAPAWCVEDEDEDEDAGRDVICPSKRQRTYGTGH